MAFAGRGMPLGRGALTDQTSRQVKASSSTDSPGGLQISVAANSIENAPTGLDPSLNGSTPNGTVSEEEALKNWDPMKDDYNDKKFNSYDRGPGRNLPADRQAPRLDNRPPASGTNALKLYVSGIPEELTEVGIKNLFSRYGKVVEVVKMKSKTPHTGSTFGFVSLSSVREAHEAMRMLDKRRVGNHFLKVMIALSKEEKEKREREKQEQEEFIDSLSSRKKNWVEVKKDPPLDVGQLNAGIEGAESQPSPSPRNESGYESDTKQYIRKADSKAPVKNPSNLISLPCVVCQKPSKRRCPRCKCPYCNTECQKKDWPTHKMTCTPKDQHQSDFENRFQITVEDTVLNEPSPELMGDKKPSPKPSTRRPKVSDYEMETLPMQKQVQVVLTHLKDPNDFHLVLVEKFQNDLNPLLAQIHEECQNSSNTGAGSYMPVEGELCLAQFTQDNTWYRSAIRRINLDGSVAVTYLDFGNEEELSATRLHRCKPEFLNLKLQGIRCSLSEVAPPPGGWSADAMNGIRMKLRTDGQYLAKRINMENGKSIVEIVDPSDNTNVNIVLISKGWAVRPSPNTSPEVLGQTKPDPNTAHALATMKPDANTMQTAEKKLMSPPRAPQKIVNEHQLPTVASRLSVGQEIQVMVIEVMSPSEFWVQLMDEKAAPKYDQLQMDLNSDYSARVPNVSYRPTKFNMVAAKFCEDGVWYRGQVLKFGTQQGFVRFMDFGNSAFVGFDGLHHLDSNYCTLPFLAMCCSLAGVVEKAGGDWAGKTCDFIKESTLNKMFSARVVEQNNWGVLVDLQLPTGGTMNELLVQRGMARRVGDGSGDAPPPAVKKQVPLLTNLKVTKMPADTSELLVNPTDAPSLEKIDIQLISMAKDIENLAQALQNAYASYTGSYKPTRSGELVAARYALDKNWYRAVVQVQTTQSVTVAFIDYGNVEEVPFSAIASLKEEFLQYPVQAVTCSLQGSLVQGQQWKPEYVGLFELAKVKVIQEVAGVPVIDLLHRETGQSYTQDLINAGVLQPVTSVKTPTKSPQQPAKSPQQPAKSPQQPAKSPQPPAQSPQQPAKSPQQPAKSPQPPSKSPARSAAPTGALMVTDVPSLTLPENAAPFNVSPTDAPSPANFSVQLVSMKEDICLLAQLLQDIYSGYTGKHAPHAVGEVVAAKFVDNSYYRGAVKELKKDSAVIHFVDYGNVDEISYTNLAPLKPDLLVYQQQAVSCCLEAVLAEGQTWNPTYLPIGAEVQLVMLGERDGLPVVDLKDPQSGASYTELLIGQGVLKKPAEAPSPATPVKPAVTASPAAASPNIAVISPSPAAASHSPAPTAASSPANQPPALQLSDLPPTVLPESSEPVTVNPMDASAPDCISVQVMTMAQEIADLFQALQTAYANHVGKHLPGQPGEVLAAKFSLDQCWYRAVVNQIQGETCKVRFIDYGNIETVQADSLAPLKSEFLKYPVQAVCCALVDVVLKDGATWSPECIPQQQPVNMIVLGHKGDVTLMDLLGYENGQSITESLITRGILCTPVKQPTVRSLAELPPAVMPDLDTPTVCIVTEARGMDSFYVQTESHVSAVTTVQASLAELYAGYKSSYLPKQPEELVAAVFPADNLWYRAVVKDISADQIKVQYVDYGNEALVTPALIAPLEDALMEHPIQVLHCRLHGVQLAPGQQWSPEMMPLFTQMFIVLKGQADDKLTVDLLHENQHSLTQSLLRNNIVCLDAAVQSPKSRNAETPTSTPTSTPTPATAQPTVVEQLPQLTVPCNSEPVVVVVQEAAGPDLFWLQAYLPNVPETLTEVTTKLQQTYAAHATPFSTQEGKLVAAKFSMDNQWYRAEVRQISPQGIHVRFLDFGNSEYVPAESIAELTAELREYPQLALCCSLPGVTCHDSQPWDPSHLAINQPLNAVFLAHKKNVYDVELLEPQTNESLLENLVAKGILTALPATPKTSPAPSKSPSQSTAQKSPTASLTPLHPSSNLDLPMQTILDNTPQVYPWYVIDPSCFYVQWLNPELQAKVAEQQLQLKQQGPKFHQLQDPAAGMLAVSLNAVDNLYYRVHILEVTHKEAKVVFIDFGDVAMVPKTELREIKGWFLELPKQAIPCGISNLLGTGPNGTYTDAAKAWFIQNSGEKHLDLIGATLQDGRYMVDDLVPHPLSGHPVMAEEPKGSVIDRMISAGHAARHSLATPVKSPAAALPASSPSPSVTSPRNASVMSPSVTSPASRPSQRAGFRMDSLPTKVLPTQFKAVVSHPESPDNFFIQVDSPEVAKMAEISQAVNTYCNQTPQVADFMPEVGELCCAKFEADNVWYRGYVEKKRSADQMRKVVFIDFGNWQKSTLNMLRPFKQEFTQIPAQAVLCGLDGIDKPTKEVVAKFQQIVSEKSLEGTQIHQDDSGKYIIKLALDNGDSVGDLLKPTGASPASRPTPTRQTVRSPSPQVQSPPPAPSQPPAAVDPVQLALQNAELQRQLAELRQEVERMKMQKQ